VLDLVRFEANVVEETAPTARLVRFGAFEVDLRAGELRKDGARLKLTGQPFQVLTILLEQPGEVVPRDELQKRLWPDTFVDVDHNLNTAINKIREVLGDSAESPRFVETLPRRGYRFVAPVEGTRTTEVPGGSGVRQESRMPWVRRTSILCVVLMLLAAVGFFIYRRLQSPALLAQRTLTRLTLDDGLQIGATWSPDGRFIAYSSNRGGKFDIWVQQISGGDPVQITKGPGHNWQPDWSPDGNFIAYRSENGEGGLFVVPALGGEGLERRIASFGYYPRWSPDSSQILFQTTRLTVANRFYIANLTGNPPHEVLQGLFPDSVASVSAAWHPDGKRITAWVWDSAPAPIPTFWTAPIVGGLAIRTDISAELMRQVGEAGPRREWWTTDFKFSWAPSGKAIYFERTSRAARNIWRMSVDPQTLRAGAIERLTTGPGLDTEFSLSADGKKLAFTGESRRIRAWLFPFNATRGQVSGPGHAVTSPGIDAWQQSLSRDGKKLVFSGDRGGNNLELRERSLFDGREVPIVADDFYSRYFPQWSPDGAYLAYTREEPSGEGQLMMWSSQSRTEEPLTTSSRMSGDACDWSANGKWLLISQGKEVWLLPVASRPNAEAAAQKVTSSPAYDLYQCHFSPDGRWIVFEAVRDSPVESLLYVMAATGGPWIRITDGKHWDDKPRWSPDGKTIYFVSGRNGFFNVWGIRFDAVREKPVGDPFQVTSFESPSLMVPTNIPPVELSLTQEKLVLTIAEVSGSIWVLDNVGP
jgi:Tol biopolymer transport system component/DNA-binding winged helix-turn-helix (wHTH) protein